MEWNNGIVERGTVEWNNGIVEWWNAGPIKRTGSEMCCLGALSVDFKTWLYYLLNT